MASTGNLDTSFQVMQYDGTTRASTAVPLSGKYVQESSSTSTQFDAALPAIFRRNFTSGTATAAIVLPFDCIVIGAYAIKTTAGEGTHASTVAIKNGSDTIGTIALNGVADKSITQISDIDDSKMLMTAGSTLNIVNTLGAGGDSACQVYVTVLKTSAI